MTNLPGYDAWKLASPYDGMTAEEEDAAAAEAEQQEQNLRDAIACALADERGDIDMATIRRIVIEELNALDRAPTVKAHPDVTGYAPRAEAWHAYDEDTYDGAPDAGPQIVGLGATAEAALADYDGQLAITRGACLRHDAGK